jgi:hypothetical protein
MNKHITKSSAAVFFISLFVFFNSCTVQYVAEYDESIKNEIIRIATQVEMFFAELFEADETERKYENFKERYIAIEVDLRTLLLRNKIRPLNEESTKQSEIALELWVEDKEQHKNENTVSNFIINLHRKQFQRIFIAMAKGESIKEE